MILLYIYFMALTRSWQDFIFIRKNTNEQADYQTA